MTNPTPPVAVPSLRRRLHVDAAGSWAAFSVSNLGFRTVHGTMPVVDGWVELSPDGVPVAAAAAMAVGGIATGNKRRDNDLQKPHLLGAAAAPLIRWSAEQFAARGDDGQWLATGTLEVRGVACPIELEVVVETAAGSAARRVTLTGDFDRTPLGLKAPTFMIGRKAEIFVEAWLVGL